MNEEAQDAASPKDFANKISICLKEARETHYFFRLISGLGIGDQHQRSTLDQEAEEIKRIFGAILIKAKSRI